MEFISNEKFNTLDMPVYMQERDIYLNRKQIGTALEYSDPAKAIKKIHNKHKDRLEPMCTRLKKGDPKPGSQSVGTGVPVEEVFYSHRGILEICRWSRQPKANELMDWCWDIIEKYMMTMHQNTLDFGHESLYFRMQPQFIEIEDFFGLTRKDLLHRLYVEFQNRYKVDLNRMKRNYLQKTGFTECYTLDVIEFVPGLAEKFEALVNELTNRTKGLFIAESATTIESVS